LETYQIEINKKAAEYSALFYKIYDLSTMVKYKMLYKNLLLVWLFKP